MTFLRSKLVKGNKYWYLVQNLRVEGRVVQKVVKYVGKFGVKR